MKYIGEIGYYDSESVIDGIYKKEIKSQSIKCEIIELKIDKKDASQEYQRYQDSGINIIIKFIPNKVIIKKMNSGDLLYITLNGTKWKISSISYNRPKILLTIGGLYNGE